MIKELKTNDKQDLTKKSEVRSDMDIIKKELAEYRAKEEKEKTISDILLDSHNFFNDLSLALDTIILDLKKSSVK